MEKVYLGTQPYDGGWYAFLTEVGSYKTIRESATHNTEVEAVAELRNWARDNDVVIAWTNLY